MYTFEDFKSKVNQANHDFLEELILEHRDTHVYFELFSLSPEVLIDIIEYDWGWTVRDASSGLVYGALRCKSYY